MRFPAPAIRHNPPSFEILVANRADSIAASGFSSNLNFRSNLNFKILAGNVPHSQSGQSAIMGKLWEGSRDRRPFSLMNPFKDKIRRGCESHFSGI